MHPVIPRSSSGGHAMITHHRQSQSSPFNQSILHLSLAPPFAQSLSTAHAIPLASAARARRFTPAAANTALTQLSQPPPTGHQWIKTSASIYDSLILRRPLPIVVGAILNALVYVAFSLCGFVNSEASLLHPPSHAWISIDPARGAVSGQSDVEFRQAWVCGRWMQALDKDTLVDAVEAQNYLVSDHAAHPASHDQSPSARVVNHDADSSTVPQWNILRDSQPSALAKVHYLFTTSQDQLIILSLYTLGFLYAGLVMSRRAILRSGLWLLGSIALEV
ncbi:unnamed protein product [Clonostachys rosea f. rosea IK726]|uniref:Uncharacterized protein n=1 Tax=Clonostachys rosea f. rosea IK726 TaxID=1349383 RepID=A0ACA9U4N8_BIOOC|nr:unnamed protein product [Clonostachys rosea f. rosea IK726]